MLRNRNRGVGKSRSVSGVRETSEALEVRRLLATFNSPNRAGGLRPARVLITEYPDPTRDDQGEFANELMHDLVAALEINREELEIAYPRVVQALNTAVAQGAAVHGWTLIDGVEEAVRRPG